MSDDLVKRLRKRKLRVMSDAYEAIYEACDRIEQLQAALKKIACDGDPHFACFCDDPEECSYGIARAALGEKKDER